MKDIYQVIKNVRLSEKATMLQETNNEVVLEVNRDANKLDIKRAVETLLGKKVAAVRTANFAGKAKRRRRADEGRTNHWKKAIVRLKEGETLDLV
ncbi:50S ribosomal protein L23 [Luteolibacter flavescens]|jgi:large subunit ribosomal protein L23|uniref:Large ribosomal subunit protein uL23 n=2 Tax=Luteolibacter TaxID=518753 RepID=A0ABU9AVM9_9BACT|nr:50S ribosomal protein L23 [Luteolibacter flavescens]MCW1885323.1 50S ribosomal protein L23 [Luteolibacter flavescens]RYD65784.1 MAG: 50S ribosomal protein L23 [Verrucomicrobiaceae bacterium]